MTKLEKVHGIILPMCEDIITNIIDKKKTVFAKFTTHEPKRKTIIRINKGDTLFLYVTGGSKRVIGKAIINSIDYLPPSEVIMRYKKKIPIPSSKFREYIQNRENKKMMVLCLEEAMYLKKRIRLKKPLTMTGQYVTNKKTVEGWI